MLHTRAHTHAYTPCLKNMGHFHSYDNFGNSDRFTHGSLSAVTHAPFRASMLRPARLAQCMSPQRWEKLVNAVLLSLINEACVNVCCADTLLSSELVGPACVQARSSNPRDRACRPNGKGSGEEGYRVTLYLYIYTARLLVSVFL